MSEYLIKSPHTKAECLQALDETLAKGSDVLAKFKWGCGAGDHTGYAIVEAESKSEAQNIIPTFLRDKADIVELNEFSPEQIKAYHGQT